MGEPHASANIKDNVVGVDLKMSLELVRGEDSAKVNSHKIEIDSKIGKLYDSAKKIYDYEQDELFLENYAIDNLRLYAPVDGVEITCAPKIWDAGEVFANLQTATETNTLALRTSGNRDDYFLVDVPVDEEVRFINSQNWEYSFEVEPAEGNLLIASPVGNQAGLGILGFCYVPYHFVYDVKYPVLVQVIDGDEIFQFPLAVVVQGNQPREPLSGSAVDAELSQICQYKNTPVSVSVKDVSGNSVDAYVSFECFGTKCNIGETSAGQINSDFPQCANGYVFARADGYSIGKQIISTVNPGSVSVILDRLYDIDVKVNLDGKNFGGDAVVTFTSDKDSKTVIYPEQTSVELSEGQYEVNVYVYENKELKLESGIKEQCVDVPRSGIRGFFGQTEKKCFDVEIPEQTISDVLIGGGKQQHYILEDDLKNSNTINIYADALDEPETIEDLQENYILFESKGLDIIFT
jgi:hypothetical protein